MEIETILKINKKIIKEVKEIKYQRHILGKVINNINNKRSSIITGLRQIGKTTILKQVLARHQDKAAYLTIDSYPDLEELEANIKQLILDYDKNIIIIDEIQNIKHWGEWIINIFNKYPGTYLLSGSGSISATDTTGSARFTDIKLLPLSLQEYIEFSGDKSKALELLNNYVGVNAITAYTKEDISIRQVSKEYFETYLFQDLLKYENNLDVGKINSLIYYFSTNTSGEINLKYFTTGLRSSKSHQYNLIHKHIKILEKYNIIKTLRRTNLQNSHTTSYKIYMNPHLYLIMNECNFYKLPQEKMGYLIESLVLFYGNLKNPTYIKQDNNKNYANQEIDFVDENKWIEVKATKMPKKQINKLFKEYNHQSIKEKILITLTKNHSQNFYRSIDIITLLLNNNKI